MENTNSEQNKTKIKNKIHFEKKRNEMTISQIPTNKY